MTEFDRGWIAALDAAKAWHLAQAKQVLVQARRSRFPRALEQEAELHRKAAEAMGRLSPEDV